MRFSSAVFALLLALVSLNPAAAGDVRREGAILFFSGTVMPGDEAQFQRKAAEGPVARVAFNSSGGAIGAAWAIARMIRRLNAKTSVDGASAVCLSACTLMFVGGVARHYFNADGRVDGINTGYSHGLGYHEASRYNDIGQREASSQGNDALAAAYAEFGVPQAGQLVRKAVNSQIYMVSGVTALSMGIATSLTRP
jgi:hypothetical protein